MACDECRELNTHVFRSPDDMLHALQLAAAEVDRGALKRAEVADLTTQEQRALDSAFESTSLPDMVRYRFECTVCGDRFELTADTASGKGGWTCLDR
jgi:hypothetical protein